MTRKGFTLAEMTAVLFVSAVLVVLGSFAFERTIVRSRAESATNLVVSTLRAARTTAMVSAEEVMVTFDVANDTMITSGPDGDRVIELPKGAQFARPLRGELDEDEDEDEETDEVVTLQAPGTSDTAAVFDPRGMLLSDTKPGHIHVKVKAPRGGDGARSNNVYRRIQVSRAGTVDHLTYDWNESEWDDDDD